MTTNQPPTEGNKPAITAGETQYHVIEFSGYFQIHTEPFYESDDVLNAEDIGYDKAKEFAELFAQAANLTQKHGPLHELVQRLERAEKNYEISEVGLKVIKAKNDKLSEINDDLEKQNKELREQNDIFRNKLTELQEYCGGSNAKGELYNIWGSIEILWH